MTSERKDGIAKQDIKPILLDEESRFGLVLFILLCSIPVITTLAFGSVDMWAVGAIGVLTAFVLTLWSADSVRRGVFRIKTHRLQIPFAGIILIGLIQLLPLAKPSSGITSGIDTAVSSALSIDPFATQMFVVKMLMLFIFFLALLTYTDSAKRYRILAVSIIIFGSLMAFFGIIQKLAIPDGGIYGIRPTPMAIPFGPFVNQHHFAAFMEMPIGLALGLLLGNGVKKDKRMLLWIAVFVMGLALVYTSSRGGVLSLTGVALFATVMSLLFSKGYDRILKTADTARPLFSNFGLKMVSAVVGVVFLFLLAVSFIGADAFLLRSIGLGGNSEDVTSGRGHFWSSGLQIFYENPIIGAGFEAFNDAFTKFDTWNGTYQLEYAHNEYLQALTDGGILGFACLVLFLFILFHTAIKRISVVPDLFERAIVIGASAGCFGIAIHSFFDFPLRTVSNSYYFIALAALIILGGTYGNRKTSV